MGPRQLGGGWWVPKNRVDGRGDYDEKMPLNQGITSSDICSVNCFYYTGAYEPNGHLFCDMIF